MTNPLLSNGRPVVFASALLAVLTLTSCKRPAEREGADDPSFAAMPANAPHADPAGIHNLHEVAAGLWSGSIPEGDTGFDSLEAMGIRTVIAVDATSPQIDLIRERDMRSIHIPIQYSGIDPDTRLALARAVRDADGPIYVHCHHGKHRGPAAAATAAVALGMITEPEGQAFLKAAGTSPSYTGLFRCVAEADSIDPAVIDQWDGVLVEVADIGGMSGAMAEIESRFGMLDRLAERAWQTFDDHPDRTAISESGVLHDLLRRATELSETEQLAYTDGMHEAVALAEALERALIAEDAAAAHDTLVLLGDSCNDCHKAHRTPAKVW